MQGDCLLNGLWTHMCMLSSVVMVISKQLDSFFCSLEVSVGRSDAQHLSHLPVRKMKSFIQPSNEHKIGCIPILCCSDSGYIILCCHG